MHNLQLQGPRSRPSRVGPKARQPTAWTGMLLLLFVRGRKCGTVACQVAHLKVEANC